jgi:hypothetical protein
VSGAPIAASTTPDVHAEGERNVEEASPPCAETAADDHDTNQWAAYLAAAAPAELPLEDSELWRNFEVKVKVSTDAMRLHLAIAFASGVQIHNASGAARLLKDIGVSEAAAGVRLIARLANSARHYPLKVLTLPDGYDELAIAAGQAISAARSTLRAKGEEIRAQQAQPAALLTDAPSDGNVSDVVSTAASADLVAGPVQSSSEDGDQEQICGDSGLATASVAAASNFTPHAAKLLADEREEKIKLELGIPPGVAPHSSTSAAVSADRGVANEKFADICKRLDAFETLTGYLREVSSICDSSNEKTSEVLSQVSELGAVVVQQRQLLDSLPPACAQMAVKQAGIQYASLMKIELDNHLESIQTLIDSKVECAVICRLQALQSSIDDIEAVPMRSFSNLCDRVALLESFGEDARLAAVSIPTASEEIERLHDRIDDLVPLRSKTTPCRFFAANGRCSFGDRCRFLHGLDHDSSRDGEAHVGENADECRYCTLPPSVGCNFDCPSLLLAGSQVEVFGLKGSVGLNGKFGFVVKFLEAERVAIAIMGEEGSKSIRKSNLRVVRISAPSVGGGNNSQSLANGARLHSPAASVAAVQLEVEDQSNF